jgi:uncharacterized membrane protein YcaP (DUF421 family)
MFASIDWAAMFDRDIPLLEIFLRGSCMYLGLFFMLRFILKRQSGSMGIGDMLLIVMIADAAQNGMSSTYTSVTDGLVLVATLMFWDFALDWISYHVPFIARLLEPPPLELIRNGRVLSYNMRREMMTRNELMGQLREHGIEDIGRVKRACMEPDGKLSVVEYK